MPNQAQRQAEWAQMTPAQRRSANQAQTAQQHPPPPASTPPAAVPVGPSHTPEQMYQDTYNTAAGQVNNPNYQAGSQFIQNNLGASGFGNTNQYFNNVNNATQNASFNEPLDLLRQFMGSGTANASGAGAAGSARGVVHAAPGNYATAGPPPQPVQTTGGGGQPAPVVPGLPGSGPAQIPDTVSQSGFINQQIRDLFDPRHLDPANDPTMAPYLQAMQDQQNQAFQRNVAALSAGAEGSGRYGGGMYQNMQAQAAGANSAAYQAQLASTLFGSRREALDRQMQGIGVGTQRDLGAMQDATQRYGIDAQERAANASASAAGAGNAAAAAAQERAQNLQAIGMLMGQQQFGLGMQSGLGEAWQGQQMGSLNSIPGLEGANQGYLSGMLGAAGGLGGMQMNAANNAAGIRQAQIGAGPALQNLRWQQQLYNSPENQMSMWLNILGQTGNMGGGQWGQGQAPPMIPSGPSPGGAGLFGFLGGGMMGGARNGQGGG